MSHQNSRVSRDEAPSSQAGASDASSSPSRELFDGAPDVLLSLDLDGRLLAFNGTAERLSGRTENEMLGSAAAGLFVPEHRAIIQAYVTELNNGTRPAPVEVDLVGRQGSPVPVEFSARLVVRSGGSREVFAIVREIAHRRQAERVLRQGEQRLRALVESCTDAIAMIGRDGTVLYASGATTRLLGYGLDEFVGSNAFAFVHPDDRGTTERLFARWLEAPGTTVTAEYRYRHKDGSWRVMEGAGVNRLNDEAVEAIVVNYRDITERKRVDGERRASDEQFRTLFEAAPIGIVRLDLKGGIIDANPALAEMSGFAIEELRGRPFTAFMIADKEDAHIDFASLLDGTRDSYQVERRYNQKDGTAVWANVTVSLVRDHAARPQFCFAMLENITERKRAEEALRKSNKRLTGWVTELEQRSREIGLLSEMGDLLQACRSADEAYSVIVRMARQIFPTEAGSVGVMAPSGTLVESVASWGIPTGERMFGPDECWALRRGRVHLVEDVHLGLICKHMHRPLTASYLCVPMMAQGEALGILNLALPESGRLSEAKQRLAMTVAEHLALALANLRLHETLRAQSIRDPLTNLFNRRYMEESLEREMRRAVRGRHSVGIIMLDLDHFKDVNDEFGHEAGDTVLREMGAVLQRNIRGEDIACRYGGEEFTLILPEASLADAAQRAEQLRNAIKSLQVRYRRQTIGPTTVSLGVAVYPDHGPTGEAVLRAADAALYQAKARGRDRVTVNPGGTAASPDVIVDWSGG